MAKNSAVNLDITNNADGFELAGGTTKRKILVTGGDVEITGSGSNEYTYPTSTDTLVGRDSSDTFTNKTINTSNNSITVVASDVSDFDTEVSNNSSVSVNTAKTGITAQQASDITANNAKLTYTKTNVKCHINHGSNASTARPSGFDSVEWIGSVEPINAINDDTWIDVS